MIPAPGGVHFHSIVKLVLSTLRYEEGGQAMNSQCSIYTDAEYMENLINGKRCTPEYVSLQEIRKRAKAQGVKVILINTIAYASVLEGCEECRYFNGRYPTWNEVT